MPSAPRPVAPFAPAARRLAALLLLGAGALLACERQASRPPTAAQPPAAAPAPEPAAAPETASPLSKEQFSALVESARDCAPGDACVLAGAGSCLCAQPVNAARAAELDAAAARVDCGGAVVRCMNPGAARCEAGRCVAVQP